MCNCSKNTKNNYVISWSNQYYGYMPIVTCNSCGYVFNYTDFQVNFMKTFIQNIIEKKFFKILNYRLNL